MKWTLGLLLLTAAGCGYRQTRMVACPDSGCGHQFARTSPQGTVAPRPAPPPLTEPAPVP
ncbi:MAG TPA: hypothetical protein VF997_13440 [Polyangia bacterium]